MTARAMVGARAPDFNLPLVGGGYRGLRDLLEPGGGVLVFFKEDCPASEVVVPRLGPLAEALEREDRLILAIAEDPEDMARAFRDRHGIRFPIAWEAAPYATSVAYGIGTVPTLFVVDGTGVIAERVEGFIKSEYLALWSRHRTGARLGIGSGNTGSTRGSASASARLSVARDVSMTSGGTMKKDLGVSITWLGHGTVLYRTAKGKTFLADAWVDGNPACPPAAKSLPAIDLVLITHGHSDHVGDLAAIARKHNPDVVCIHEIAQFYATKGLQKLHGMNKGGTVALHGLRVTMVHAVHSSTIADGDRLIPAGEAAGFVVELENGTRLYHAGDTGVFSDMKLIGEIYHPTIAALPIGDLYTMSPLEAAAAAKMLGVKTVLPIHHSTFPALTGTPEALREHLKGSGIDVLALKPGESA